VDSVFPTRVIRRTKIWFVCPALLKSRWIKLSPSGAAFSVWATCPCSKTPVAKLAQMGDGLDYTVYGFPSGVVGLRLFLNPDFFGDTEAAAEARGYWDRQVVKTR